MWVQPDYKDGVMFAVARYATGEAGSGALGRHVCEWSIKSAKPGSANLVFVADLMIDPQVEASDFGRVGNQLKGVDAGGLRCRLRKEQVLQLNVDLIERDVDLVSGERLFGQRIDDDRVRCRGSCAAAAGEKAAEVAVALGCQWVGCW